MCSATQRELERRGYIYKSSYSGWYAVSDEAYVPESQVAEVIDEKSGEKYMASPVCSQHRRSK